MGSNETGGHPMADQRHEEVMGSILTFSGPDDSSKVILNRRTIFEIVDDCNPSRHESSKLFDDSSRAPPNRPTIWKWASSTILIQVVTNRRSAGLSSRRRL